MSTGGDRTLHTDPVRLEQEACRAGRQAEELRALLAEMTRTVEGMCENWTGAAGEAFLEEYRSLTGEAYRIAGLTAELSARAAAYAREQQEAEALWNRRFRG